MFGYMMFGYMSRKAKKCCLDNLPGVPHEIKTFLTKICNREANAPRTLLMFGVSGVGKTTIAHAIAKDLGVSAHCPNSANIMSEYSGETHKNIAELFENHSNNIKVIFFDEVDSLLSRRRINSEPEDGRIVNTLLTNIDKVNNGSNDIVLIAATNFREKIDNAGIQRFRIVIEIRLSSVTKDDAEKHLKLYMDEAKITTDDQLLECYPFAIGLDGRSIRNAVMNAISQNQITKENLIESFSAIHRSTEGIKYDIYPVPNKNGFEAVIRYDSFTTRFRSGIARQVFIANENNIWSLSFESKYNSKTFTDTGEIRLELLQGSSSKDLIVKLEYGEYNKIGDQKTNFIFAFELSIIPDTNVFWKSFLSITSSHMPRTLEFKQTYLDLDGSFQCKVRILSG